MDYLLFEKSAAEEIVNRKELQSLEYSKGLEFVDVLKGNVDTFDDDSIILEVTKSGRILCGKEHSKTILVFDLTQCKLLERSNDTELIYIIQKALRFAIRYWGKQPFTPSEIIAGSKAVIFPFPYSNKSDYRLVIEREPDCRRLHKRNINMPLLVYKYGQGAPKKVEIPNTDVLRQAGEEYLDRQSAYKELFVQKAKSVPESQDATLSYHIVETDKTVYDAGYYALPFEQIQANLTLPQKDIVNYDDISAPIRIEGAAGTGKTLSLMLRAIKLLDDAANASRPMKIIYFTHSKSTLTEAELKYLVMASNRNNATPHANDQKIIFSTLQDYCAEYIDVPHTQIIDSDALEAKQFQLYLIQEAYQSVMDESYSTYLPHLSKELSHLLAEEKSNIASLLQHEFSVQIKGGANGVIEKYLQLTPLENGIPTNNEDDKNFIFKIYKAYQKQLETQSVFDTDDIVIEADGRLNGPFWRRDRARDGFDYIIVDEMHLFNINEQQIFHYLTKDIQQKTIPICFALDYSQAIGDRGLIENNYIEHEFSSKNSFTREYGTVFRSSQQIAELCASITASGATLFSGFIDPYRTAQSGFTNAEDSLSSIPELLLYKDDSEMIDSLYEHVVKLKNDLKCPYKEIAVINFADELLNKDILEDILKSPVQEIQSRSVGMDASTNAVVLTPPENANGLEFAGVILVGVDEGRVPQSALTDISSSFLKYSALNKLYLACSRAKYRVLVLGTQSRGVSECLRYSISKNTIICKEIP